MSNLVTIAFQTVEVTWTEGNNWTFEPSAVLVRDQNLAVIVYALTPDSTPGVRFASTPVVWNKPATQPTNLGVALLGDPAELCMTDINTAQATPEIYSFFLQVELAGVVYQSPDPTIVNTEPPHIIGDVAVVSEVTLAA